MSTDASPPVAGDDLEAEVRELRRRLARAEHLLARGGRHEIVSRVGTGGIHELRNLLTGLTVHARLLLEEKPIGDPDRESLLRITQSAKGVVELLARFRSLAAGAGEDPTQLDLGEEVERADPLVRTLLGEWIVLDVDYLEPARVVMGREPLRRLLLLLALNAHDRMPGGGMVRLAVEKDRSVADDGTVQRWAVVSMTDTGEPMSGPEIEAALDPLSVDPSEGSGLGMGLMHARSIVERAGGRLTIEPLSTVVRVRVDLPFAGANSSGKRAGSDPSELDDNARHILVVDDDHAVREVAVKILRRFGYRISDADSGAAALELLAGLSEPPDMLLSDIVMPGMNGRELAQKVEGLYPEMPVLFMSAYTEDEVILHGIRVAEVNFLPKPFTLEGLAEAVRSVLETGSYAR